MCIARSTRPSTSMTQYSFPKIGVSLSRPMYYDDEGKIMRNLMSFHDNLQYCYVSEAHLLKGVGTLSFYMVNMRGVFQFGFFRGGMLINPSLAVISKLLAHFVGFDNPTLAAVSNIVSFKNPNEPLHGHLALTNDITEMVYVINYQSVDQAQMFNLINQLKRLSL